MAGDDGVGCGTASGENGNCAVVEMKGEVEGGAGFWPANADTAGWEARAPSVCRHGLL